MKKISKIKKALIISIMFLLVTVFSINMPTYAHNVEIDPDNLISFPWMVFNGSGKISIDSNQQNYKLYYQAVEMPVGTGDKIDKITKDTNKAIEDSKTQLNKLSEERQSLYDTYQQKTNTYNNLARNHATDEQIQNAKAEYEAAKAAYEAKLKEYNDLVDANNAKLAKAKEDIKKLIPGYVENNWIETKDGEFKVDTSKYTGDKEFVIWAKLITSDNKISYDESMYSMKGSKKDDTDKTDSKDTDKKSDDIVADSTSTVIEFKDNNLYNAIVDALGDKIVEKGNNKIKIKNTDLEKVTKLELNSKKISNVSGIEKFENLVILDLSYNDIVDITPLKQLKNLTDLYVQCNKIEDISAIENYEKLLFLSVGGNKLDLNDLKVLDKMITSGKLDELKGLWLFDLGINNIDDIDFVLKLKGHLECLDIHGNNFSDVSFLADFDKINTLYLFNNKIENLDVLKKMKSLAFHNPANQHITIIAANKTIDAPVILKQAFKDLETTKIETTNCKVNDDKTKITIEDTSKDATIKIVDGKLVATTITIKYDKTIANKAHLQAGKSMAIVGGIVVLAGTCFIMYKKNKSLIIK